MCILALKQCGDVLLLIFLLDLLVFLFLKNHSSALVCCLQYFGFTLVSTIYQRVLCRQHERTQNLRDFSVVSCAPSPLEQRYGRVRVVSRSRWVKIYR